MSRSVSLTEVMAFIGPANLATAFVAINFIAFAAFGVDKARAEAGQWRVAEDTLLLLAFVGGSPGAWAGRRLFRHKTRKQPFNERLVAITVTQVAAVGGGIGWWLVG